MCVVKNDVSVYVCVWKCCTSMYMLMGEIGASVM